MTNIEKWLNELPFVAFHISFDIESQNYLHGTTASHNLIIDILINCQSNETVDWYII